MTDQSLPLFKGEAMLLSWGDTSSRGKTVTFALHPNDCGEAHPFRDLGTGKHGQRFGIVAIPLSDDEEQPVSPGVVKDEPGMTSGDGVGSGDSPHPAPGAARKEYTLANRVGMTCNDPAFREWLYRTHGVGGDHGVAEFVRGACGVESRADILPGTPAAAKWHALALDYEQATGKMAEERR